MYAFVRFGSFARWEHFTRSKNGQAFPRYIYYFHSIDPNQHIQLETFETNAFRLTSCTGRISLGKEKNKIQSFRRIKMDLPQQKWRQRRRRRRRWTTIKLLNTSKSKILFDACHMATSWQTFFFSLLLCNIVMTSFRIVSWQRSLLLTVIATMTLNWVLLRL